MKTALVVIDMQKQFLPSGVRVYPELAGAIDKINHVAEEFRKAGLPVIWVQDRERMDESHPGFPVLDALKVHDADLRVSKVPSNAFCESGLPDALDSTGAEFVLFAGYCAEQCVLATVRGAADRELDHAILRGSILSHAPDAAGFVERISPVVSYEVAVAMARANAR